MSNTAEEAIRAAFNYYDANGNGKVSSSELKKVMDHLGLVLPEEQIKAVIAQYDFNQDGEWEWTEFKDFYMKVVVNEQKAISLEDETAAVFKLLDADKDGRIDNAEIKAFMIQIGQSASEAEIQELINAYDANKTGVMEFDEFTKFYKDAKASS